MIEEDPLCPECGWQLTGIKIFKDDEQKIIIEFFCDEAASDRFRFQILTGMTDEDLEGLHEIGKEIPKKMAIKLLERKADPSLQES